MKKNIISKISIIFIIIIMILIGKKDLNKSSQTNVNTTNNIKLASQESIGQDNIDKVKQIDDWKITLVNKDNPLPDNFKINLANIDEYRQFDVRAINELNNMILAMREEGISNIWVQSAYRSIKKQQKLFNNSVNKYMSQGKSKSKAEELTLQSINKAGTSEHNLGLAVDFNNINDSFEQTKAFSWLLENAEDYGFILRYKEDKENITGIEYEPWHWRYVGVEHAKIINEMQLCLEEYIDYLLK